MIIYSYLPLRKSIQPRSYNLTWIKLGHDRLMLQIFSIFNLTMLV